MALKLVISEPTVNDMLDIRAYIEPRSPQGALSTMRRLANAMRKLSTKPYLGHARPDVLDPDLLVYRVGSYVIVYLTDAQSVTILRVIHGARDFTKIKWT